MIRKSENPVSDEIKEQALEWEEVDGILRCPHCHADLQEEFDNYELESFGSTDVIITKDPYFCECSSEMTVYWKCPKCGKPIEEGVSWDN